MWRAMVVVAAVAVSLASAGSYSSVVPGGKPFEPLVAEVDAPEADVFRAAVRVLLDDYGGVLEKDADAGVVLGQPIRLASGYTHAWAVRIRGHRLEIAIGCVSGNNITCENSARDPVWVGEAPRVRDRILEAVTH